MASILGPLLGGVLVDSASWRWIFSVNIPLSCGSLVVLGIVLPNAGKRGEPIIDYLGAGLIAAGLSASVIGLIVAFAMFGAITFMPLFFQTVKGASPTASGPRMVPMMVGLLVTSIGSGRVLATIGRYKPFPIAGAALMAVGFLLLAGMGIGVTTLSSSLRLFVLSLGLALVMQVLVLAVQNAVDYADLGVATSGATLFRSIGRSLGTVTFGAVFSGRLSGELGGRLTAAAAQGGRLSPTQLANLSPAEHAVYAARLRERAAAGVLDGRRGDRGRLRGLALAPRSQAPGYG